MPFVARNRWEKLNARKRLEAANDRLPLGYSPHRMKSPHATRQWWDQEVDTSGMWNEYVVNDGVEPSQWAAQRQAAVEWSHDQKMLVMVTVRAIQDAFGDPWVPNFARRGSQGPKYKQRLKEEAREWLWDDEPNRDGFSFLGFCEEFDLEPSYVRRKLLERGHIAAEELKMLEFVKRRPNERSGDTNGEANLG